MGKVDDMEDKLSLVGRLRAGANGVGSLKSGKGDFGLLDDAADEIERLGHGLCSILEAKDHSEAMFRCVVVMGGPDMKVSTDHNREKS